LRPDGDLDRLTRYDHASFEEHALARSVVLVAKGATRTAHRRWELLAAEERGEN